MPCVRMLSARSAISASSNVCRGWYGLRAIASQLSQTWPFSSREKRSSPAGSARCSAQRPALAVHPKPDPTGLPNHVPNVVLSTRPILPDSCRAVSPKPPNPSFGETRLRVGRPCPTMPAFAARLQIRASINPLAGAFSGAIAASLSSANRPRRSYRFGRRGHSLLERPEFSHDSGNRSARLAARGWHSWIGSLLAEDLGSWWTEKRQTRST